MRAGCSKDHLVAVVVGKSQSMITHINIIEVETGYEWFAYNHAGVVIAKSPEVYQTIHEANHAAMVLKGECLHGAKLGIIDIVNRCPLNKNNERSRKQTNNFCERLFRPRKSGGAMEVWGDQ